VLKSCKNKLIDIAKEIEMMDGAINNPHAKKAVLAVATYEEAGPQPGMSSLFG